MKRTNEPYNVNNRTYWNGIYSDDNKRAEYAAAGTSSVVFHQGEYAAVDKTHRFERAVEEIKDGDKVADIGCGIGNFTKLLKKTHPKCEIWGTDISDKVIEANKKEDPDIKYFYQHIGHQTELPDNYFDVVFCGETIEHLDSPEILFQDAQRVLKKGGKLIITTPNEDHIKSNEHVWFYERADVKKLFEDNGFKDVQMVELPDIEHLFVIFGIGVKV